MNTAIERLESKIAYLESANNELSDVVYRQQRELDELRVRVAALIERLSGMREDPTAYTPEQERPPHY